MVTEAQLAADPFVQREIVTPEFGALGKELRRRTGRPADAVGIKGDNRHLKGAHRSNEFIRKSPLCTNRTSTLQSGLTPEQERHIAAFDFTPGAWGTPANRAVMKTHTTRLRAAMLDGRLPGLRQVIGTLDGTTVTGTNADGSTFDASDSHLDHWHLTFDRRRCRDQTLMERVVTVVLGEKETDVIEDSKDGQAMMWRLEALQAGADTVRGGPLKGEPMWIVRELKKLAVAVGKVDEAVAAQLADELAALGGANEQADLLRKVLGDRAADVGALLAEK
ncbi:hypothetical protein [Asanoa siamensis]|uniref:Uncharacterized protein n=1 Tax=Asanoa siamensis TaxID=926357 RepID=A0ABQ4CTV1_9ACTN|nr:hypothetical protein [Asanoa siamensis]GIF74720.1 hypothetical protein Asi02nite_42380 [Asanoa siamensis]